MHFVDAQQVRSELGDQANVILSEMLNPTTLSLEESPLTGYIKDDPLTMSELRILRDAALTEGSRAVRFLLESSANETADLQVKFYGALACMIYDRLESTGKSLAREPQSTTLAEITASFSNRE